MTMIRMLMVSLMLVLLMCEGVGGQTREEKVRGDKAKVEAEGFWIYNDLPRGFAEAKKTGQPLLVVLRCIPCEQCVKLDDDLVEKDERLRPLLEKFVRVRVVSANGLDLSLFQFDTDQSFAVFMLNAEGTIYGRYGTRSDQMQWTDDVSIEGLAKALDGALALHRAYPANKAEMVGKKGPPADFAVPEQFPKLKGRYGAQLNYEGNVVQSCIHCHQIGDAHRQFHLERSGKLPVDVLFPYPHPKAIGLILDPKERAKVLRVEPGSPAEKAGLVKGDEVLSLSHQPMLSLADVQWVLHHVAPSGGSLNAVVKRDGQMREVTLDLPAGWRLKDDIAWRASSWELRRVALGGMNLKLLTAEQRMERKVPADGMALRVEHTGQFAPHDVAKKAGVKKEDVLIRFDGRNDFTRETDLLAYALEKVEPRAAVEAEFLRDGERVKVMLGRGK
jgi:serine protease Do